MDSPVAGHSGTQQQQGLALPEGSDQLEVGHLQVADWVQELRLGTSSIRFLLNIRKGDTIRF